MKPLALAGRAALVTGSTQGIGQAIAASLGEAGARVIYHGLEATDDINSLCLAMDLAGPDAPERLMNHAFFHAPDLDILVCNAAGFFDVPFLEMTPAAWERTYALNVRAPYFLVQAFARHLVEEKRGGAVVIVSSTNGLQAETDSTAYDSSKGALMALTRSLAVDLAAHSIRVNCLAPGLISTPLTQRWLDSDAAKRTHYEKNIPLGRVGLPHDCGGAVAFLVSDAAAYITGQIIIVDGGLTASQIGPV